MLKPVLYVSSLADWVHTLSSRHAGVLERGGSASTDWSGLASRILQSDGWHYDERLRAAAEHQRILQPTHFRTLHLRCREKIGNRPLIEASISHPGSPPWLGFKWDGRRDRGYWALCGGRELVETQEVERQWRCFSYYQPDRWSLLQLPPPRGKQTPAVHDANGRVR